MKILVLGDIHGRKCWYDIISKEAPDKVIFLGDYVSTHENITSEEQIANLKDLIEYKQQHKDSVIMLRGNHDIQHLGYYWAECSGKYPMVAHYMSTHKDEFIDNTQWVHVEIIDGVSYLFSHAGVSKVWLDNNKLTVNDINNQPINETFAFTPNNFGDMCGYSETQPCTWIRPATLLDCGIDGYIQVVGHTPVSTITNVSNKIWLCDALPMQYLIIEDGKPTICDWIK